MKLFRAMREASDGLPVLGATAATLGVRPGFDPNPDVSAVRPTDFVFPAGGGMSVSPHDLMNLPSFRIPRSRGGTGRFPVWVIECDDLGLALALRLDRPTHGLIEPGRAMPLQSFQAALQQTRGRWLLACR